MVVSLWYGIWMDSVAQNDKLISVTITAAGFKNCEGQAILNVFKSSDGFPGNFSKAYKTLNGKIEHGKITFTIELPTGEYAFSCVHDENGNNKMDKKLIGLPKEGAGLSNYTEGGFPSYEKARVSINRQTSLTIKVNYL